MSKIEIQPFLKWAGGKRWLTESKQDLFPKEFGRYFEPFLGGGAVFFSLSPQVATLSDLNADLIETYAAIRDNWQAVLENLKTHHRKHSKPYYYQLRASSLRTPHTRAARFIYLNRTCWNGLYRVNLDGEFNVPIGTKTQVVLPTDNFALLSQRLANVDLRVSDFEATVNLAGEGDLVFVDPPYTVRHNYNGFVKYNERIFSWDDQVRLSESLRRASDRGCFVVATNAFHPSVQELYRNSFEISAVSRRSVIAANSLFRGKYEELLITNF
ncbi:MAG TPA: Dam family site-specific DNA-(adenine-N6)-methyltransferase [Gallionella sp.]|nr:Dam family site-specific DNA-(adenine-N6)-methyltransferase [Gallionella sp.]